MESAVVTDHRPVMRQEVLSALALRPGGHYIDCTVGSGGHASAILVGAAGSRLLALDLDPAAVVRARAALAEFDDRAEVVHASFTTLADHARRYGFYPCHGVLFDLGVSSPQLADPQRGFSFQLDGPLDMRLDPGHPVTAADLVNELDADELADLIFRYGEERFSRRIARAIVQARPLHTTGQLAQVVARAVGRSGRIHPATRTFQALRIAVNDELGALEAALPQAVEVLAGGGRLAVISFHSLEDRIVKHFLRREARDCICPPELPECRCGHRATIRLVQRQPLRPTATEVSANPRARSARLRVAERLPPAQESTP